MNVGQLAPVPAPLTEDEPVPGLTKLNPLTRLVLAVLLSLPLLVTLDWVSGTVALAMVVLLALALGMRPIWLLKRAWWLVPVAALAAVPMVLYGAAGGAVYWHWWLITVSQSSVRNAIALFVRVFALAVPSLILFAGLDATRVADALTQVGRLPARFVYGTVAGMRLSGLFLSDWRSLARARRARGVADQGTIHRTVQMGFALLVIALRRGGILAVGMEARGLGTGPRSAARVSRLTWRDPLAIGIGFVVTLIAITSALFAGTFAPVVLG